MWVLQPLGTPIAMHQLGGGLTQPASAVMFSYFLGESSSTHKS